MAGVSGDNEFKIEKLNGNNYQSWKFNTKLMLMQKELWGIVEKTEVMDTSTEGLRRYNAQSRYIP